MPAVALAAQERMAKSALVFQFPERHFLAGTLQEVRLVSCAGTPTSKMHATCSEAWSSGGGCHEAVMTCRACWHAGWQQARLKSLCQSHACTLGEQPNTCGGV